MPTARFSPQSVTPPQLLFYIYLAGLAVGSGLFMLPYATQDNRGLPFLDALFMATSALCVTGLAVVDPGSILSRFGQVVLMSLIQIGGIGLMTIATFMAVLLGKRITIRNRSILKEALNHHSVEGTVTLVITIIISAFLVQGIGGVILSLIFTRQMPTGDALFYGFFHAVSAFNNAGFDLFGNSLINFRHDVVLQLTVITLFVIGGLGFLVLLNIVQQRGSWRKLSLHSKLVLSMTAILCVTGTITTLAVEYTAPAFADLSATERLLASFFNSMATRSAGMNTIPLLELHQGTLLLFVVLMFVGSSPSSTGGGVKSITIATSFLMLVALFRGKREITVFRRTISNDVVLRSFVVLVLAISAIFVATFLLTVTENISVLTALFEVVSAFGTVGLSLGLTPELSDAGRIIIIVMMTIGRLGPLTIFYALAQRLTPTDIRHPEEPIIIG
ncbi:MAG: Potassium uptake protein integral rane component, KtrB [Chloroflexota bacterium]|jgi:trk system potassium uptake protein TrkH